MGLMNAEYILIKFTIQFYITNTRNTTAHTHTHQCARYPHKSEQATTLLINKALTYMFKKLNYASVDSTEQAAPE